MDATEKQLLVLGGSGFIGRRVIREAVRLGWRVKGLARSDASAAIVTQAGAAALRGEADNPDEWAMDLAGSDAVIDLIQPPRARRLGRSQMRKISRQRQIFTERLAAALLILPPARRPRLVSVSGIDDLAPDTHGFLSANSLLSKKESGFNTVGLPVRAIIERAGVECSFVYLASVYGPGGPFGDAIFPAIASGKWRNFGAPADQMILIHVDDAARGLVRIAGLDLEQARNTSFVLADNEPVGMSAFAAVAARSLGVALPRSVPKWLATLFAGKPIVETTLHQVKARPDFERLPDCRLLYPTYREGVPSTLQAFGHPR